MKHLYKSVKNITDGTGQIDDYQKYSFITICVAIVHIVITVTFFKLEVIPMYLYNTGSVIIFSYMSISWVRKKYYARVFYISFVEILFHSVFASVLVGWDWGFMIYTIALIPVAFYLAFTIEAFHRHLHMPFLCGVLVTLCFLGTKTYCLYHAPVYTDFASAEFISGYYCFNSLIAFLMLLIFSLLFVIEIRHMQRHLELEKESLDAIASHDPLTQLLNRRSMEIHLENVMETAKRSGAQFSVILGDIDDFKLVNDTYGHDCGDKVLIHVADLIRSQMRGEDHVCRWGGEEILLLIHANGEMATQIAERVRKTIEKATIHDHEQDVAVTMTFGVSSYMPGFSMNKLIQIADDNLYVGKNNGKNQVVS